MFREGRRRLLATGGAIAGVVAVVAGAVMVTGLLADESRQEDVPPAASRTAPPSAAPPSTSAQPKLLDVRLPPAEGRLSVSAGAADPARVAGCADVPDAKKGCAVRVERGIQVAMGTWRDYGTGEKRYIAVAVRPDGTRVTAIASNLSDTRRDKGAGPAGPPALDQDVLTMQPLRCAG